MASNVNTGQYPVLPVWNEQTNDDDFLDDCESLDEIKEEPENYTSPSRGSPPKQ